MDSTLLVKRIEKLCKEKGVTANTAFTESKVGKNFKSNLSIAAPSKKNLSLLAQYFNVSVEYLTGKEDENAIAARAMGNMIEWLEDNGYEVSEDENNVFYIGKNGAFCHLQSSDFLNESLAIKEISENGFELAMLDWEKRNLIPSPTLSPQEKALIDLFRSVSEDSRLEMIVALKTIQKDDQKKSTGSEKKSVG